MACRTDDGDDGAWKATRPMEFKTEYLTFEADIEVKQDDEEEQEGLFTGLASTFGNKDLMGDIILPTAFDKSLKRRGPNKVKLLLQHDSRHVLGIHREIEVVKKGLKIEAQINLEKQIGRETLSDLRMGALDALSIGFRADPAKQEFDRDKGVRILMEIDLLEISVVTFPANPRARITNVREFDGPQGASARDDESWADAAERIKTVRDFECHLRDAGYSANAAKAIAAGGFKQAPDLRDEAGDRKELIASFRRAAKILAD
jgi:HK97 family phage prohead protease